MTSAPPPRWWTGRFHSHCKNPADLTQRPQENPTVVLMKFSGELVVPAPREAVFDRLRDANFFVSCVDGVSGLTELTPDRYAASFVTKIAYIRFEFEVTVAIA